MTPCHPSTARTSDISERTRTDLLAMRTRGAGRPAHEVGGVGQEGLPVHDCEGRVERAGRCIETRAQ